MAKKTFSVHELKKSPKDFTVTMAVYADDTKTRATEIFSFRTTDETYFNTFYVGDKYNLVKEKQ